MDHRFLEFWGNYLLMVARGQRQLEDITRWMEQGFKGFDDITAIFSQFYNISPTIADVTAQTDHQSDHKSDHQIDHQIDKGANQWTHAMAEFQKSWGDWMALPGLPRPNGWSDLEIKIEALEKELVKKDKTIRHLQTLLDAQANPQADAVKGFAELIQKQAQEFQDILNRLSASTKERKKDAWD